MPIRDSLPDFTTREWLRASGVTLLVLGLTCFPMGYSGSPEKGMSLFSAMVYVGLIWKAGLILIAAGALVLIVSIFIHEDR